MPFPLPPQKGEGRVRVEHQPAFVCSRADARVLGIHRISLTEHGTRTTGHGYHIVNTTRPVTRPSRSWSKTWLM
jgi:hypothetical protein